MGIIKYYDLDETEIFIFDEFIINQIKEGVEITAEHKELLNDLIKEHFSGRNMVYVSNRAKSYSVNPLIYPETSKIPNLIAIAMIPKTDLMRQNALYEKEFFPKPYEIFERLTDAIDWVGTVIDNESSK